MVVYLRYLKFLVYDCYININDGNTLVLGWDCPLLPSGGSGCGLPLIPAEVQICGDGEEPKRDDSLVQVALDSVMSGKQLLKMLPRRFCVRLRISQILHKNFQNTQ